MKISDIENAIVSINDFPKKGIVFRDITPLFLDPIKINFIIDEMAKLLQSIDFDVIVAPESRGYLFAVPLALKLNKPFVMVRKPNKLPRAKLSIDYELEYGHNILEIHKNDIKPNSKVLIVDDLLATGGTSCAIQEMVKQLDSLVVAHMYLIELEGLIKDQRLIGKVYSLIKFK